MLEDQRAQQSVLLPVFAEQMGFDIETDDSGNITNISKQDDPQADLAEEIETMFLERSKAALEGDLPVSPALEQDLAQQEQTLRDTLSQQLGPGFETSSPGIEALGDFQQRAEALREEARTGQLTLSEQLGMARQQQSQFSSQTGIDTIRQLGIGDQRQLAGAFGQVASGFGSAQAPFIQQRQMQFQADAQNAQSSNSLLGNIVGAGLGAAGSLLGTPAAGAAIFSDRRLKEGAEKISEDLISPIYIFTIGGERRIGRMADEVVMSRPGAVTEQGGYLKVDYGALEW